MDYLAETWCDPNADYAGDYGLEEILDWLGRKSHVWWYTFFSLLTAAILSYATENVSLGVLLTPAVVLSGVHAVYWWYQHRGAVKEVKRERLRAIRRADADSAKLLKCQSILAAGLKAPDDPGLPDSETVAGKMSRMPAHSTIHDLIWASHGKPTRPEDQRG